jgi:hypothetical protein
LWVSLAVFEGHGLQQEYSPISMKCRRPAQPYATAHLNAARPPAKIAVQWNPASRLFTSRY